MATGVSGPNLHSFVLDALKRGAALVDQHGPGAIHGFIAGLEYGAAMAPAPVTVTVTQEERRALLDPATLIAASTPTPEPQGVPVAFPRNELPAETASAPTALQPTKKMLVLEGWNKGLRTADELMEFADCKRTSVHTYLGQLRAEGLIPRSAKEPRATEEAPADALLGKQPQQSEDPPPPLPPASSPSASGEGWSAAIDAMTELRDAVKSAPPPSSESLPSPPSHGHHGPSESPSPATTSSTGSRRSPQPKPSRDEMMARVGSFSLPSTKTPATAAGSTDLSPRIPNSTGDVSPYGGQSC